MASERRNMPEQERSIKDREQELFFEHHDSEGRKPLKPFSDYVKETPAAPISTAVKVILWALGVLVALLLLAALWRTQRARELPPPKSGAAARESEPSAQAPAPPYPTLFQDGTIHPRRFSHVVAATPRAGWQAEFSGEPV